MKTFLRKAVLLLILISLAGCGKGDGERLTPNAAAKTDEAAVRAMLDAEEVTGEITVSCYTNNSPLNDILSRALITFQVKYPNVKVNIIKAGAVPQFRTIEAENDDLSTSYSLNVPYDDSQERIDYLTRLSTELISGGGPDILQVDIFPFYKYADSGYLEDMRTFMDLDADFNKDDMWMNALDGLAYKDGIYVFPLSFNFNFFAYDASLFNDEERGLFPTKNTFTFGELFDMAEGAFERNNRAYNIFGLTGYKDYSLFDALLEESYASFVDIPNRKAAFDDGRFEQLLLSVTEYCKKGYIQESSEIIENIEKGNFDPAVLLLSPNLNTDERFFFKHESNYSLMQNFVKDIRDLNGNLAYYPPTYGNDDNDVIMGMAADYNGNIPFRSSYMYAINSNSKNKRAAWEFIKALAGEGAQSLSGLHGVPINKNALERNTMAHIKAGGFNRDGDGLPDKYKEMYDDYLACLKKFAGMVNTYAIHDDRIDQMLKEEVSQYFAGIKSAKDTAAVLQNKVKLYLSE